MDAYDSDVRPLLAQLRAEQGLDPDPVAAYHRSGYQERIIAERLGGTPGRNGAADYDVKQTSRSAAELMAPTGEP